LVSKVLLGGSGDEADSLLHNYGFDARKMSMQVWRGPSELVYVDPNQNVVLVNFDTPNKKDLLKE
jgi:hypothetical protein